MELTGYRFILDGMNFRNPRARAAALLQISDKGTETNCDSYDKPDPWPLG